MPEDTLTSLVRCALLRLFWCTFVLYFTVLSVGQKLPEGTKAFGHSDTLHIFYLFSILLLLLTSIQNA